MIFRCFYLYLSVPRVLPSSLFLGCIIGLGIINISRRLALFIRLTGCIYSVYQLHRQGVVLGTGMQKLAKASENMHHQVGDHNNDEIYSARRERSGQEKKKL